MERFIAMQTGMVMIAATQIPQDVVAARVCHMLSPIVVGSCDESPPDAAMANLHCSDVQHRKH
jgi:hypothetical protein